MSLTAFGVKNQPATIDGPPIMQCLVEAIENETRMVSPACSAPNYAASEGIDNEREVNEAVPRWPHT